MPEESIDPGGSPADQSFTIELETALREEQFFLVYQPSIDLQTDAFAGVEALLRWRHPQRGVVAPDDFVPALEASGLILPVGRWALASACRQCALWHSKGYRFSVSVNVSPAQLLHPNFVEDVIAVLADSRIDSNQLVLEFSEQILMHGGANAVTIFRRLAEIGIHIAIDDFTLGTSALTELLAFPIDMVKLTRLSLEGLTKSADVITRIHDLVELSRSLNVQIVASGIEDAQQRMLLQLEQIDIGQGFYFSRPHEVAEIDRFLEDFALFSGMPDFPLAQSSDTERSADSFSAEIAGSQFFGEAREAIRRTQRIASQLHQLIATSITVASQQSAREILTCMASNTRDVFDADVAIATLETGPTAPLWSMTRRSQLPTLSGSAFGQAPIGLPNLRSGTSLPWMQDGWLTAPILLSQGQTRGVLALRRESPTDFSLEDREVLTLLAQMATTALESSELGRTIQNNEARLRVLVETAPVGIIETDLTGNVKWWNRPAATILGWPAYLDDDTTEPPTFPDSALERLHEIWSEVTDGAPVSGRDLDDVEIGPRRRELSASAALLATDGPGESSILTLIDDVTDSRELRAELRHAHTMEVRGQVASRIAHDFNNLLTLISGYAEILSHDLKSDERASQMVHDIQATASRASLLTQQLQAIGRTKTPAPVVFAPAEVIQSNAEVLERILGSTIQLKWSIDRLVGNVRVDADQFEQMILNLSINARDAMPDGGELSIAVAPAAIHGEEALALGVTKGDYVRLTVADTGIGMDEATLEHCFEPLFTTKGPFKGTGMGLAAARRLVHECGGAITCRSAPGRGTIFDIVLPSLAQSVDTTPAFVDAERPRGSASVLLVDDDEDLRRLMGQVLRRNGYQVSDADSSESALALVEADEVHFDLLVSDVVMAEMSGADLASLLQRRDPTLRVLLVSGTADPSVVSGLLPDSGDFLAKPFKPSQFIDKVHALSTRPD